MLMLQTRLTPTFARMMAAAGCSTALRRPCTTSRLESVAFPAVVASTACTL